MKESAVKDTFVPAARIAESITASKEAVATALEEGKETVTTFVKHSRHAVEDWMDDATHNIKRFPIGSVVMAFSVGGLFGVLLSRNGKS